MHEVLRKPWIISFDKISDLQYLMLPLCGDRLYNLLQGKKLKSNKYIELWMQYRIMNAFLTCILIQMLPLCWDSLYNLFATVTALR